MRQILVVVYFATFAGFLWADYFSALLLALDCVQQVLPRIVKGFGFLRLQIGAKFGHINSDPAKLREHLLAVRAATRNDSHPAVLAESEQSFLGHGVN
jgi:hypothetical protein